MRAHTYLIFMLLMTMAAADVLATEPGAMSGGVIYELPNWFKSSFLDLPEDAEEARVEEKHVLVFMHLDECPYCARMLEENFLGGPNAEFIQQNFDVIAINVRGELELRWIDGELYTEKALARELQTFATPTIVILDPDTGKVLQIGGYRDAGAFRQALNYVESENYRTQTFQDYLSALKSPPAYSLRDHPAFTTTTYFKGYQKPLAVLFEDSGCVDCDSFHDHTLSHPEVVAEMQELLFVRLDTDSSRPIVDLQGRMTTAGEWASALGLTHRPAMVVFAEGEERFRMDSRLYHFHFKEVLRYASGGHYRRFPKFFGAYTAARRQELLSQGVDIDYSE